MNRKSAEYVNRLPRSWEPPTLEAIRILLIGTLLHFMLYVLPKMIIQKSKRRSTFP